MLGKQTLLTLGALVAALQGVGARGLARDLICATKEKGGDKAAVNHAFQYIGGWAQRGLARGLDAAESSQALWADMLLSPHPCLYCVHSQTVLLAQMQVAGAYRAGST